MKLRLTLLSLCLLGMASPAFSANYTFTSPGGSIPEWWFTGQTLNVNFNVSGVSGDVSNVLLELESFSGNFSTNCRIDLSAPTGTGKSITLADSIGPAHPNGNFIFDDSAAESFADASPSGGTYRPQYALSAFDGLTAAQTNSTWTLAAIAFSGDTSLKFTSATLTITTAVPEPGTTALVGMAGLFGAVILRRRRVGKNSTQA